MSDDLPKEIWAYMDCRNGALWHEPTHPADQDAINYIRADHHTAEVETLKADIETYIKISSDQANVIEALKNLAQKAKDKGFKVEPETILFLIEEKS